jgi:hypothetical protein
MMNKRRQHSKNCLIILSVPGASRRSVLPLYGAMATTNH